MSTLKLSLRVQMARWYLIKQGHHHNEDQAARRPHILCSICADSVGPSAKAVRLFIASFHNQTMYPTMYPLFVAATVVDFLFSYFAGLSLFPSIRQRSGYDDNYRSYILDSSSGNNMSNGYCEILVQQRGRRNS